MRKGFEEHKALQVQVKGVVPVLSSDLRPQNSLSTPGSCRTQLLNVPSPPPGAPLRLPQPPPPPSPGCRTPAWPRSPTLCPQPLLPSLTTSQHRAGGPPLGFTQARAELRLLPWSVFPVLILFRPFLRLLALLPHLLPTTWSSLCRQASTLSLTPTSSEV